MGALIGYDVVFNLATQSYEAPWLEISVGLFGSASATWVAITARTNRTKIVAGVLACASAMLMSSTIWAHWSEYTRLRNEVAEGRETVLEGRVNDFRADAANGNGAQRFSVAGRALVVRSNDVTAAFHDTVGAGGPDLSAECVRVILAHDEQTNQDKIVWLGIRREGCADEAEAPETREAPQPPQ